MKFHEGEVPRLECEIDGKSRNSFLANKKVSVEFKRGRFGGGRKQESIERKIERSILRRSSFGNDKRNVARFVVDGR